MRTAFIEQLVKEAELHEDIVLVVGDLGYSVVEVFAEKFPNRFFNAGIAEQSMAGMAAGLAHEGYNVYLYSIGNFPTLRCMEQLRYDVAYHGLSVKIVAVGAGYAYGSLGASHHATEDIAMMRAIPDTIVATPGDPVETKAITHISANTAGMMYIRLGKAREAIVHTQVLDNLAVGDIIPVIDNNLAAAVLACGSILAYASERVSSGGVVADLYSVPFVKPLNIAAIESLVDRYAEITVLEEHQLSGGVGSAIVEVVSDLYASGQIHRMPRIHRVAIKDTFCHIGGTQQYLREEMGLTL